MTVTLDEIKAAAQRIKNRVVVTPCPRSIPLSEATGLNIFCKLEHLQRTGSFKERGACNSLLQLSPERKKRGVIAASAGNHALGLSYHGKLLEIPVTVVMPVTAPLTKATNCKRLGATVILHGNNLDESRIHADEILAQQGQTYINGFNDPEIIAGQGTMGLEIVEQVPDLDAIIVPIGGAGLIAGVSLAIKSLKPSVQVIGVEAKRAASYTAALAAKTPVQIKILPTLADGLAVAKVGDNAFQIAQKNVDRVVLVDEHEIALAILRLIELEKSVVEGAGATPLAACLARLCPELAGKNVVLPLCGGNIDTNILGRVLERGLVSDGRLCQFSTSISDRPGGLAHLASIIAEEGASIVNIAHDRAFASDDINLVTVHCIVETRDAEHIENFFKRLNREGFFVLQQKSSTDFSAMPK